jgi:dienelactone hydrolase
MKLISYLCITILLIGTSLAHENPISILKENPVSPEDYQDLVDLLHDLDQGLNHQYKTKLYLPYKYPKRDRGFCYVLSHCKKDYVGLKIKDFLSKAKYNLHRIIAYIMNSQGYLKFLKSMEREKLLGDIGNTHHLLTLESQLTRSIKIGQWSKISTTQKVSRGVVMIVTGSGGIRAWTKRWAKFLAKNGYDTFILDAFTARGYKHRRDVGWVKATSDQADDIAKALQLISLSKKETPVFLMGFSMGGYSILKVFVQYKKYFQNKNPLKGSILFYPRCRDFVEHQVIPVLLIIGGDQDYRSPITECQRMLAMSPFKSKQTLHILKGATHAFDVQEFKIPQKLRGEDGITHELIYSPKHYSKSQSLVLQFLNHQIKQSR